MRVAKELWQKHHGNIDLRPYDQVGGVYYLAKTAALVDFDYSFFNLERIKTERQLDTFGYQQGNSYVPDHVRHTLSGKTLVLRPKVAKSDGASPSPLLFA